MRCKYNHSAFLRICRRLEQLCISTRRAMLRLFQRPRAAAAPQSQGSSNCSSHPSLDRDAPRDEDDPVFRSRCLSDSQHSLLRVSRAGLAVPFTELPAPSQLRDSGYVEMAFTRLQDPSLEKQQQQQSSPPSSDLQQVSLSPDRSPKSSMESGTSNVSCDSSNMASFRSGVGNHISLRLTLSPLVSGRDLVSLRSPSLSPSETQLLTMPEIEVHEQSAPAPKSYFALALCSALLCCLPIGVLALISSQQVRSLSAVRDRQGALLSSRKAKYRSLLAIALGCVLWTLVAVTVTVSLVLKLVE